MHASDGFAAYKGVRKRHDPERYPDAAAREGLRQRLTRERDGHA